MSPDPAQRPLPQKVASDPGTAGSASQARAVQAASEPGLGTGCFVALVGPSGAGKDTLLTLAMAGLADETRLLVARRVVTRAAVASVEDHDTMSEADFQAASAAGRFCIAWQAHGLSYGLPADLCDVLAAGTSVVANISRRALPEAAACFPRLAIVEITAPREVLVARIAARGRETPADIKARVARRVELVVPPKTEAVHRIVNDASPETGAAALLAILDGLTSRGRDRAMIGGQK